MSDPRKWSQGTRFWIISSSGGKSGPHILDSVRDGIIYFHPQYNPCGQGEISLNAQLQRLPGPYPKNLCPN